MYSIFEQLLQKYGVSTYKVSKDTGIAQSVFSAWKNGISTPKQDKMQKLADYFNVSLEYLYGSELKPKGEKEKYLFNLINNSHRSIADFSEKCGITEKELHSILTEGIAASRGHAVLLVCNALGIQTSDLDKIEEPEGETLPAGEEIKRLIRRRGKELTAEDKIELIRMLSTL